MALDGTDLNDNAQLIIFVHGVKNQFKVTEELLNMKTMKGHNTTNYVFEQLCDAIKLLVCHVSRSKNNNRRRNTNLRGKRVVQLCKIIGEGSCRYGSCLALHYPSAGTVLQELQV